jgi:5-methyltetrahydrofolate--homocysteine methyltransferase
MELLKRIAEGVVGGDEKQVAQLTGLAIEQSTSPKLILDDGLIAGMNVVGRRFKEHEIFLPDVLLAARAMYAGMDLLKPLLVRDGIPSQGKVVLGTIQGDLHDIGKNLVAIMLKGAGFEIIDLGNDVAPQRFVQAAKDQGAKVIGMSALLTTTMIKMRDVVELLEQQKLAGKIKTIVGGAPVSEAFAHEIGADAHGFDAASAVERVKILVGEN